MEWRERYLAFPFGLFMIGLRILLGVQTIQWTFSARCAPDYLPSTPTIIDYLRAIIGLPVYLTDSLDAHVCATTYQSQSDWFGQLIGPVGIFILSLAVTVAGALLIFTKKGRHWLEVKEAHLTSIICLRTRYDLPARN
jgi:hypothetical protein